MAAAMRVFEANLPVPTMRREVNSRPAILSLSGLSDIEETMTVTRGDGKSKFEIIKSKRGVRDGAATKALPIGGVIP